MKTVSFSVVAKFPPKKVVDCFSNPAFAKLHTASKLFGKTGVYKSDKKGIVRAFAIDGAANAVAVILFSDADEGKATKIDFALVNVPDEKAAEIKGLGKIIGADIAKFLAPKPVKATAKKTTAVKNAKAKTPKPAAAKKSAKAVAEKKAAKPAVAKKAAKPAGAKKAAKPAAAKKVAKPAVASIATTTPPSSEK